MDFPHFLKRHSTSSIAERVRLEVSEVQSNLTEKEDTGIQDGEDQPQLRAQSQAGGDEVAGDTDTDIEGGDTDVVVSSEGEGKHEDEGMEIGKTENRGKSGDDMETPPIRMSKRLMSLKRRGKFIQPREETEQIEFYAGDILTVRGGDTDFFVCRVLEDVLEDAKNFSVAWYNRIGDNLYEVCPGTLAHMFYLTHQAMVTLNMLKHSFDENYKIILIVSGS